MLQSGSNRKEREREIIIIVQDSSSFADRHQGILGYNTMKFVECQLNRYLHIDSFVLVSCFTYYSTLKKEAICSSETSVDFQRATRRYIPEYKTLHNQRYENRNPIWHISVTKSNFQTVTLLKSYSKIRKQFTVSNFIFVIVLWVAVHSCSYKSTARCVSHYNCCRFIIQSLCTTIGIHSEPTYQSVTVGTIVCSVSLLCPPPLLPYQSTVRVMVTSQSPQL
jgi:hypothetical protein